MDFLGLLFILVIFTIFSALTVGLIIWVINYGSIVGGFGEEAVRNILSRLPKDEYIVLNDILLSTQTGTTQIDHIVVSIYGIFVIETKNYKGWIMGGENAEYWTQSLRRHKFSFYNPIKQNNGHVEALKNGLGLMPNQLTSIVTFSPRATIKVKTNAHIVYYSQLIQLIKSYNKVIFNQNEVQEIVNRIMSLNIVSKEARAQHAQKVRNISYRKENMTRNGRCPKCGGTLVLKNGKYGQFYGCNNYPNCKFTFSKR